jgi:hypothetical protein
MVRLMHGINEERINEDDEVILELDISSVDVSVAQPKRHESNRPTVPYIVALSVFMIFGFGALGIALYAQIGSISNSESIWHNIATLSGMISAENIFP